MTETGSATLRLVRLGPPDRARFLEMAAEYEAAGEDLHRATAGNYESYLQVFADAERGEVPDGYVPWTTYWMERVDDGRLIGGIRLRHALSERLWQDGGHIGYDVRPSERNRGYATAMLALCLEKARARGLPWVLLTVDPKNAASVRVMEKNGARRIGVASETGYFRYRIDLTPSGA